MSYADATTSIYGTPWLGITFSGNSASCPFDIEVLLAADDSPLTTLTIPLKWNGSVLEVTYMTASTEAINEVKFVQKSQIDPTFKQELLFNITKVASTCDKTWRVDSVKDTTYIVGTSVLELYFPGSDLTNCPFELTLKNNTDPDNPTAVDSTMFNLIQPVQVADDPIDDLLYSMTSPGSLQIQTDSNIDLGEYPMRLTVVPKRYIGETITVDDSMYADFTVTIEPCKCVEVDGDETIVISYIHEDPLLDLPTVSTLVDDCKNSHFTVTLEVDGSLVDIADYPAFTVTNDTVARELSISLFAESTDELAYGSYKIKVQEVDWFSEFIQTSVFTVDLLED